jgi:CheY-like chemotaxis protein
MGLCVDFAYRLAFGLLNTGTMAKQRDLVLVVDDDSAVREVVAELLKLAGYEVVEARNGSEALAVLVAGARPGVIVLDLAMPVMSGRAFLAAVATDLELAQIPVIVVSGSRAEVGLPRGIRFLNKPLEPDQLVAAVAEVFRC